MCTRLLLAGLLVALVAAPGAASAADPRVVAAYPNPAADGDAGEHVVVDPAGATNLTLTDGEAVVSVPARADRVALSPDPEAARNLTDLPVVRADLALANGGERLRLRAHGRTVDALAYEDAPEAERRVEGGWRPLGYRPRSVHEFGPADATAFVLPDDAATPLRTLRAAQDRLLLAGYTLTSPRVVDALVAAARRGVRVRVLVEAEPVGGLSRPEARALDRLAAGGVDVRVIGGSRARFAFFHPKYAVVDDRALVMTENWKPAGVGGKDSRGWGVRVDSPPVARDLAGLFRRDASAHDARPWTDYRRGRQFEPADAADGSFPSRFDPTAVRASRVSVLTAPGNAADRVIAIVDGANERVDVLQPTLGRLDGRFVRATVRAARRGVRVRILLSPAWYVEAENRALVERLNERAERRDLPLEARVADPNGRYGKIHAKGLVADDTVVVGSLNWNPTSATENREVALALHGEPVAEYYRRTFRADWRGGRPTRLPPAGLALAAALAAGVAVAYLRRRIAFEVDVGFE